ncbi:[FeFe]-hydrogenase maturation GTPase HydF [Lachnospiraceae bacterium KM106-2]|nr:[FeFe]-hydrogenase maturation GTPase HydF [Lachnospiraceae bacterium KM106-2]
MEKSSSLNSTPSSERVHIGFFGMRNAGKSSVVNAILGQQMAIVSDVKGTTTDPVYKAMELLPLGPVVIIDTPGIDDEGELGALRIKKSRQVMNKSDGAVLIVDSLVGLSAEDQELITLFQKKQLPYLVVWNKSDETSVDFSQIPEVPSDKMIKVSAKTGDQITELKNRIAAMIPKEKPKFPIVSDLIQPMDFVVLVVPIDSAAPKGRLILPQQQTIRDVLDSNAVSIVVKETELEQTLASLGRKPKLVITDSQAFGKVSKITPDDILLTSFSILFARYKGNLSLAVEGAKALDSIEDGDTILISEGCTHHRQCDDIGTVKMPRWIKEYTGKEVNFEFTSGTEYPEDLSKYKMVVHCGGCMLNEREMKSRLAYSKDEGIPITNYGILIAYMKGILERSLRLFPDIAKKLS